MARKKRKGRNTPPQRNDAEAAPSADLHPSPVPEADLDEGLVRWGSGAMALVALVVYALTTRRGLAGGDSGELTIVSSTWGIAHPPGYPLFTMVGQLFSALPFGSAAFRINLVSAVFDAMAAGLLCMAVTRWRRSLAAGITAASLFAFSPTVWTFANAAEVFSLNNFFGAGLLLLTALFARNPSPKLACIAAGWAGLGIGNHQTLLFIALPCLVWALRVGGPAVRRPAVLARILLLGLLGGLLPSLYLVGASFHVPLMGWGDTSTWHGLWHHILRGDYGTFRLSAGAAGGEAALLHRMWIYLQTWPVEFLKVGWLLGVVGAILCMQNPRDHLARLWLCCMGLYVIVFNVFNNARVDTQLSLGVQERFYQQANLFLCAFAGAGLVLLLKQVDSTRFALPVACVLGALQMGMHYSDIDRADSHLFEDFGRSILQDLPKDSVVINQGDHTIGALRYLQMIDGLRPDVWVIDAGALSFAWSPRWVRANFPTLRIPKGDIYADSGYPLKDLVAANPKRRFFLLNVQAPWDKDSLAAAYKNIPYGYVRELVLPDAPLDVDAWLAINERAFGGFDVQRTKAFASKSWESYVEWQHFNELRYYGTELLLRGIDKPRERELLTHGTQALQKVADNGLLDDPWVFKNLGLGYRYLTKYDNSYEKPMLVAWKRFLNYQVPENPEIVTIRGIVAEAERTKEASAAP